MASAGDLFLPDLLTRSEHSTVIIGGKLYSWGGARPNMPLVHDSAEKMKIVSFVEVFDILSLSWSRVSTVGIPPAAAMGYSCASINNMIYFFGGDHDCKPSDCYHNDVFALNATSNKWSQVLCGNTEGVPMEKIGHDTISFSCDEEKYLLTIGRSGLPPTTASNPSPSQPGRSFTNETNIFCVSSLPAQWTVPFVTGTPPPPLTYFTLNKLPEGDRAILFGGRFHDYFGPRSTNDVYIVTYSKDCVNYEKLDCSLVDDLPMERCIHSSAILTTSNNHYLLVIGGLDGHGQTISDCWILDMNKKKWRKIDVPDTVTSRHCHSISSFTVSDNCVWVLVTGGYRQPATFVTGLDIVVIVELVYSDDWSVTNVWNNEHLYLKKAQILSRLTQHLWSNRLQKEISSVTTSETDQLSMRLKEKEEENESLRSDLRVSNSRIEGYKKLLLEKQAAARVHEKMSLGKSQELEILRKRRATDLLSDPENQPNSTQISKEKDFDCKKPRMSEKVDPEPTTPSTDLKGQNLECIEMEVDFFEVTKEDLLKVQKVDVGVQFNYVSLETDHLQGVTISRSKLFTVHGDQPQSLIWDGHGFELHLPANICLPTEDCEIMVDAVVGGEFVFPKGVEPVSAIYIISVTSKLRKPSLLKIQHCVALDKASKHSCLSFYRASLKEPRPPYHFRRIKGGKFDITNQLGELELQAFCSMAIGKDSATDSSADESSSDTQSVEGRDLSSSSGFSDMEQEHPIVPEDRDSAQSKRSDLVDSSIIFYGQTFYWEERFNHWQFKFIVVKHLDAFTEYVRSNLKDHSSDLQVSLRSSAQYIELILDKEDDAGFKGWSIEPHTEPLMVSLKHASSFGYEKQVSVPPSCLVTVVGDNSVADYVKRLHYPVLLKGALFGEGVQQAKIFVKRTITEKDDSNPVQTQQSLNTAVAQGNETIPNTILQKSPKLSDAYRLTKSHSAQWEELGRELEVPFNFRKGLRNNCKNDKQNLEDVLHKWIETKSVPVTWSSLINALEASELMDVIEKVNMFLKTPKAIEYYGKQWS